ncbi:MAG: NAD+ synthase [candidate division Zixibacteria bacterium]|nr:NAD+ synthase [candidate division Zixibacteria bacterium]
MELNIDSEKAKKHLIEFINAELDKAGFSKLVLGISGGIDSAVVAYLSVESIGADNVTGVILPYAASDPDNIKDAEAIIKTLGINRRYVDITPMVDAYFDKFPTDDNNRRGNKMARERMSVLFDISAELEALVIGTSNKSEIMVGYGTLYGDLACAFNPLGNFYKTQIRQLAGCLGIAENIINKPPSADLWQGQTDEGELGITYEKLDRFLYYYIDKNYSEQQLLQQDFTANVINLIKTKITRNEFKRRLPKIAPFTG